MAWYLHVVELGDGRWACRHGADVFDRHAELDEAVDHIRQIASTMPPAEIFLHHADGTTERISEA